MNEFFFLILMATIWKNRQKIEFKFELVLELFLKWMEHSKLVCGLLCRTIQV